MFPQILWLAFKTVWGGVLGFLLVGFGWVGGFFGGGWGGGMLSFAGIANCIDLLCHWSSAGVSTREGVTCVAGEWRKQVEKRVLQKGRGKLPISRRAGMLIWHSFIIVLYTCLSMYYRHRFQKATGVWGRELGDVLSIKCRMQNPSIEWIHWGDECIFVSY